MTSGWLAFAFKWHSLGLAVSWKRICPAGHECCDHCNGDSLEVTVDVLLPSFRAAISMEQQRRNH